VIASNFAGTVLNDAAHLIVNVPLHFDPIVKMNGTEFQVNVWGTPNRMFVLQASTDLQNWISLSTNILQANPSSVMDPGVGGFKSRFDRVRDYP
jgi:hypothetical protein